MIWLMLRISSAFGPSMTAAANDSGGSTGKDSGGVEKGKSRRLLQKSRLVGRSSYRILQTPLSIVKKPNPNTQMRIELGAGNQSVKASMEHAFVLLDEHLQDMPFHAGEIHLQVLTAMLFSDFDFQNTLVFLVNFGRDNDTTAAIAGAILGAFHGFEKLPDTMKHQVISVNQDLLDIDLNGLAENQAAKIQTLYGMK